LSDEAKRAVELGEVLSLLAHDLKNPLAAVLTNLGFVTASLDDTDEAVRADAKEAMVDVQHACESLQRFVANLELIGRAASGRVSLLPYETPLDLGSVVDEVVDRQRESAIGRRLRVRITPRETTVYARGDRDMVLRAAENLVANAIQCAPAGSDVDVAVEAREVASTGGPNIKDARITVYDQGAVIPAELRETIATPSGQVLAKGRPEARYGRGLGLYAAAIAASFTGGRVEYGEHEGKSALSLVLAHHEEDA
jgi:K+-sensing histidine kinase KdpD